MIRPLIAVPPRHNQANLAHTAEAVRAISLTRRTGAVRDAYAGCDRAPFNWENNNA